MLSGVRLCHKQCYVCGEGMLKGSHSPIEATTGAINGCYAAARLSYAMRPHLVVGQVAGSGDMLTINHHI
jgi:hypothetical protein